MKKLTFKIEKGIEIPSIGGKSGANENGVAKVSIEWPFSKMKKGDSILVPLIHANAAAVRLRHEGYTREHFTTRKLENGMRIWCIK